MIDESCRLLERKKVVRMKAYPWGCVTLSFHEAHMGMRVRTVLLQELISHLFRGALNRYCFRTPMLRQQPSGRYYDMTRVMSF